MTSFPRQTPYTDARSGLRGDTRTGTGAGTRPGATGSAVDARVRADAIRRWEILDMPPDCYHEIAALAARLLAVPYAVVTIMDENDIWFHGRHGLDLPGVPIGPGLCQTIVTTGAPHGLPDASLDPTASANPLVAGEFGMRFYLGVPLRTADGHTIGTLSVFDTAPRPVPDDMTDVLTALAGLVVREFEIRLAARAAVAREQEERLAAVDRTLDLEAALGTHGTIGQAMGILMAQRRIGSEDAFAVLRRVSQNNNVKLADVARRLVTDVESRIAR
ncbi:GAF and ANTAR domain-containing protein [Yinghuangia sp. ASG 101]|uniref:GAF and ANTAR domain-containing protein n=1 Tax=Yinghuangia sp. ASG 101 TaxID=2896848 RepID=UPI001E3359BA|nr:GAF and ANTAR domain-containing protein [Yinghuangia sp. ASG 101]UGQ14679.1 GAF and ANTAR domain-containing protein [Yinghuangia sp. ASG 101]